MPDANIVPVKSTSDVITLMNLGQKNRAVGSTAMNNRSSRSHRYRFYLLNNHSILSFCFSTLMWRCNVINLVPS